MEPSEVLVAYVGMLALYSFFLLWLLNRNDFPFEPLIVALSALTTLIVLLKHYVQVIDYWLSWLLVVIAVALFALMMYQRPAYGRKWHVWTVIGLFGLGSASLFWYDFRSNIRGATVTVVLSAERGRPSIDALHAAVWEGRVAEAFQKETGAKVEIVFAPPTVDERLEEYLAQLKPTGGGSKDVDVYAIDVISTGILAPYAEDLKPAFANLAEAGFNRTIIENNTVDGRLVAVPWYSDVGLLFYRKSLLDKYGYKNPPQTWDDLEKMAKTIQDGELKQGRSEFWGFIWQGARYEGLTCNALEWQTSHGGGLILDANNNVAIILQPTIAAWQRAKSWIGTISPQKVLEHTEAHTFKIWQDGNAAFMRNWPYAYDAALESGSPALHNDVGVTVLPRGTGRNTRHASTLGGWQLMVNTASEGREKTAAIRFIQFLIRKDIQLSLAKDSGRVPALDLYDHPEVMQSLPFIQNANLRDLLRGLPTSALVTRPSKSTGYKYQDISKAYYKKVHAVLSGDEEARSAVEDLQKEIEWILRP